MRAYDIIFLEVTQSFEKLDRNRIESHIISKEGVGHKNFVRVLICEFEIQKPPTAVDVSGEEVWAISGK